MLFIDSLRRSAASHLRQMGLLDTNDNVVSSVSQSPEASSQAHPNGMLHSSGGYRNGEGLGWKEPRHEKRSQPEPMHAKTKKERVHEGKRVTMYLNRDSGLFSGLFRRRD